jgi:hypothetical protein
VKTGAARSETYSRAAPLIREEQLSKFLNSDQKKLMSRYLLGESSEAERFSVEERFFGDDDYFAEMLVAEDELVEKYLSGALSPAEQSQFERHFLASPKRRERVAAARAFHRAVEKLPSDSVSKIAVQKSAPNKMTGIFAYIFAPPCVGRSAFALAALIIVAAGAVWLFWRQRSVLNEEISRLENERVTLQKQKEDFERRVDEAQEKSQKLTGELQTERSLRAESEDRAIELQRENERLKRIRQDNALAATAAPQKRKINPEQTPAPSIITFLLTPGLARDFGEEKTLRLPAGVRTVVFSLNLQRDEYPKYQVSLQTPEGREVWRRDEIRARRARSGPALAFPVPARLLNGGVYVLTLNGQASAGQFELVNQYAFSVVNK